MVTISLIIPCYNQELYIADCLDSVLCQTYTNFEAIVINDGSADKSLSIIQEYAAKDTRIVVIDQKNQGVVSARNNAIAKANGEYIYPLDGDDKIAPTCLELLYTAMIEGKGDVIYSDVEFFGDKTGMLHLPHPTKLNMLRRNCLTVSALYRKADAQKYNGYDVNMNKGLEDWEFWYNFVFDNKIFYKIPRTLMFYRHLQQSRNTSFNKQIDSKLKQYIYKKHGLVCFQYFGKVLHFLYQEKIDSSGKRVIKICKIPIRLKK